MNRRLGRILVRLYPRPWRERYGAEFAALLEADRWGISTALDVMGAAVGEWVSTVKGGTMSTAESRLQNWSLQAPWAMFGIVPLGLLAAAYGIALFLLWSGWRMFLPLEIMPFVRVDGWAFAYFGLGRFLYLCTPVLVGFAIAWLASRSGVKALWPVIGMALVAWVGGSSQVRVSRMSLSEPGHVGMALALGHPGYAVQIFAVSILLYLLLRMYTRRMRAASL